MQTTLQNNGKSGYLALGKQTETKYQGSFFSDGNSLVRALEDTHIDDQKTAKKIWQTDKTAFRSWINSIQEAFQFQGDTVLYERRGNATTTIFLDVKQSYDNRSFGRHYSVEEHENGLLIRYNKTHDASEEQTFGEYEYFVFLCLSAGDIHLTENWIRHEYSYDAAREGTSGERYVFRLLTTTATKWTLTMGKEKKKVLAEAKQHVGFLADSTSLFEQIRCSSSDAAGAAKSALLGLLSTMHGRIGLLAGFPWFFQYWTRDEAISAGGLVLAGKVKQAKQILLHLIGQIDTEGRIPNRIPAADLGCADGVGWTFSRLHQLYDKGELTTTEQKAVAAALTASLTRLEDNLFQQGLVYNRRLETWMDTVCENDVREGFRIEIQALTLRMYAFTFELTGKQEYRQKEEKMRQRVRDEFWNKTSLRDGKGDGTIRPNLFLAAYAYPQFLNQKEWERCFDVALEKLWLPWGGLATIEKDHPLYRECYTGQNNQSYHRGDSWFFVNDFAAIALHRCNSKKYKKYVEAIYAASEKDILKKGAFGAASEVSSAAKLTSHGCWSQAWSNALFLELNNEICKSSS